MKKLALSLALFGTLTSATMAVAVSNSAEESCCAVPAGVATGPLSQNSLYQTEVSFTNDRGEAFDLVELRGRPVVLTMFFANCSHACPMLVTAMQELRASLPEDPANPPVYVLVSFDVERDTPAALAQHRKSRLLDEQWELLHGDDDAVRELAALLGIKYQQDAAGGFAHSNVISILNPEGEVVHQRMGLKGGMVEAKKALWEISCP